MSSDVLLEDAELRDLAMSLIDSWNAGPKEFELQKGRTEAQFVVVYGLAAHAHRLAKAALMLLDEDLVLEAMPTVRSLYEHALTAQWVGQDLNQNGAAGFFNEYRRARRATAQALRDTGRESSREKADRMEDTEPWKVVPDDAHKPARNFSVLCRELDAKEELYSYYRIMSAMAHASGHIVDSYVETVDPFVVRPQPQGHARKPCLYMCCVSLVLAGRAFDWMTRSHPRREELRKAARTLGIVPELQLSEAFYDRIRMSKTK